MSYSTAILRHPSLTEEQRATLTQLIREFGAPFAFSAVAGSALPTWQNIGTVSIRIDGSAHKVHNGETINLMTATSDIRTARYVATIRPKHKREYASTYLAFLRSGKTIPEPTYEKLSYKAAQSVRMQLTAIYHEWFHHKDR